MPADAGAAVRAVPLQWENAIAARPSLAAHAALLRDELHAVTNRVERLVLEPGSRLAVLELHETTVAGSGSTSVVLRRLRIAAERLADLIEALRVEEWAITGRVRDGSVSVRQLVHLPLHHSHRDLATRRGDVAVVPVTISRRRWR